MSSSALASLTAQYTDSENEEDKYDNDNSLDSQASQVIIPKSKSPVARKRSPEKPLKGTKKKRSKKVRRLVSYQDDTIISDEEDVNNEESSTEDDSGDSDANSSDEQGNGDKLNGDTKNSRSLNAGNDATAASGANDQMGGASSPKNNKGQSLIPAEKLDKFAHYKFTLPPEPKGKPTVEVVEKIRQLSEKMQNNKLDMNAVIQRRKEFRNPSIYEKLIEFCDINEFGTNYPPEIYDPLRWGPESFYEELAKVQKNEMSKRQKERKDNDKIEQATALARKVEEEAKKRKSKWDQPAKPIAPPTLTTTVTGTKGTVISAFGSLPKKSLP